MERKWTARLSYWLEADRRHGRNAVLHLYCGIAASGILFLLGLSGAVLTFGPEIDRWLNPRYTTVAASPSQVPLERLAAEVLKRYPGTEVRAISLPESPTESAEVELSRGRGRGLGVAVNPHTGEILGDSDHRNHFVETARRMHSKLFLGGAGEVIVYFTGVALLALGFTGARLWWRRRRFTVRSGSGFRADLHSVLGFYAALFVFTFSMTAIRPVPAGFFQHWPRPQHLAGGGRLPAEELLAIAAQRLPGAKPTFLEVRNDGPSLIWMRFPEDRSDGGKSWVVLNPYSGAVVGASSTRELSAAGKYAVLWNWEIHTGTIFGMASRVMTCAACLAISGLAFTGVLVWSGRRVRRRARTTVANAA